MTIAFDHRDAGTAESAWAQAGLDRLPSLTVTDRRLVVLAAHPDDETLGAGGLIAAAARRGAAVTVVVATDGENSHPGSPTHSPAELARIRRAEVTLAVARLAPRATVHHLGLTDGMLEVFSASLEAALSTLVGAEPALLVTPWREDGHPDHEACARAAERLAEQADLEVWQFPIWGWHWGTPDRLPPNLRRLDLDPAELDAKRAALEAHVSQHRALSDRPGDEPVLPPPVLSHFERPFECFVTAGAPAALARYFEALYARADDPWGLGERFYEQRKRGALLAALPRPRFRRAFEPGCATGLTTEQLLARCDEVVAWDVAAAAVAQARDRLPDPRLSLSQQGIPDEWPGGTFDLIVLSEVGYYCADLAALTSRVLASLDEDGVVVACHWRHAAADHPHSAEQVHAALDGVLRRVVRHEEDDFRLDVWSRTGESVARAEGIV